MKAQTSVKPRRSACKAIKTFSCNLFAVDLEENSKLSHPEK